jgi:O-antigen/teichoic acid export membrane protein
MTSGAIEHRAAKVSLVTGLSTLLTVAFQLVSVPVCLKYWGQESYGSWLALFSAFMLLRSLDTGLGVYVGNKLNQLYHQDTDVLRQHLSSAVAGIALIGFIQLVVAVGALSSDRLSTLLGMPPSAMGSSLDRLGLVVLMVSWVLTGSYLGIVHRLLIPSGLMYQAAWWFMLFQVSQFAAIMSAALLRLDILQTSIVFSLCQVVIYVASAIYVKHKLPQYFPWWRGGQIRIGLKDLQHSSMLTASNLIQQVSTNGVILLVSALGGLAAVPVFTTVRTLCNLWTNVTNVLVTPLLPDVVRFHAKGEPHKLAATNEAYGVLVGSIVNWGVLLSYPLLALLYSYWTRNALTLDTTLLCFLLASVVVANAGALMAMVLNGINSLRIVFTLSLVRCILGLGGGVLLYRSIGLAGFGVGIFVAELVVLLLTAYYFVRYELLLQGVKFTWISFAPTALGTGSVLLFLVVVGCSWLPAVWAWPFAMAGVVTATRWGWVRLDEELKMRLAGIINRTLLRRR